MTLRLVSWFARTCVLWALAFAVLHAGVAQASISLSVTYTGDNFVKAFYVWDGTTMSSNLISAHPSNNNWQQPTTAVLNGLSPGTPYTLYFRVWNDGPYGSSGNPAAFLAEITGDVTGNLVTNSSWEWALDPNRYDPNLAPNSITTPWTSATQWVYPTGNPTGSSLNGGNNIWTSVNGGQAIPGISTTDAHWIWSNRNGTQLVSGCPHNYLWLRTEVTTAHHLPEPMSALVWGGLAAFGVGLAVVRRRRRG